MNVDEGRRRGALPSHAGSHATAVDQIQMFTDCAMPVTRAIGAASWTARRYLGLPSLTTGAPADLVVYDADPRRVSC